MKQLRSLQMIREYNIIMLYGKDSLALCNGNRNYTLTFTLENYMKNIAGGYYDLNLFLKKEL
jgi:hypothetical protein